MIKLINIEWETDGNEVDLPTEVIIEDYDKDKSYADILSDEFGWLVKSVAIEEYK